MNILLVHQNFPGQFKHLAPELVNRGDRVAALTMNQPEQVEGVEIYSAPPKIGTSSKLGWAQDFETKLLRGESAFRCALKMRENGFTPDVILGHMGWGDTLFLKEVWPQARLGIYCEFFYRYQNDDSEFDPEFVPRDEKSARRIRLKLKSLPQRLHFDMANGGISPTLFQADTYPCPFRKRITVVHDGIDTGIIRPRENPSVTLANGRIFTKADEVITFVGRNLEPYRGYHVFMRALPRMLQERPRAHVFIVGNNGVSYGAAPPESNWRDIFFEEVKNEIDVSRVHFVGHLPHNLFLELLALSRLHIYLTYPFVLSWSLLEAMALGAPILGSATAPVREVIKDGYNGLLVDFFDGDGLVHHANRILDCGALRSSLGTGARKTAVDSYDLRSVCLPQQLRWVDGLAKQIPRPPLFE